MNDRLEVFTKEAAKIESTLLEEIKRLLNSGMIDDKTANCGIIRVALENIASRYTKSYDHTNLTKI